MPFIAAAADVAPIVRRVDEFTRGENVYGDECGFGSDFDVNRREIAEVQVGETTYPLKRPLEGAFLPDPITSDGEFRVRGFSLVGHGANVDEAMDDWKIQLHILFQELFSMRPFEMDTTARANWRMMSENIDVAKYRNIHPVKVRQFGHVEDARHGHYKIAWDNGERWSVRLGQMPAEFAMYKAGQPFEAIVVYQSGSMEFMRVEWIAKSSRPPKSIRRKELWEAMTTSADLPDATWE